MLTDTHYSVPRCQQHGGALLLPGSGGGSRPISSARARCRDGPRRRSARGHPETIGACRPRGDVELPTRHRQLRDRRYDAREAGAGDPRRRWTQHHPAGLRLHTASAGSRPAKAQEACAHPGADSPSGGSIPRQDAYALARLNSAPCGPRIRRAAMPTSGGAAASGCAPGSEAQRSLSPGRRSEFGRHGIRASCSARSRSRSHACRR